MASIIQTNTPSIYNLSYGHNVHSFYDNDTDGYRFVSRVFNSVDDTLKADVRQLPNLAGYAHFDVQNILKTYTKSSPNLEEITKLQSAQNECFQYYINYGAYDGTSIIATGNTTDYVVFNGRKNFDELDWDYTPYVAFGKTSASPVGDALTIDDKMIAMTDRTPNQTLLGSDITDGKPSRLSNSDTCYVYDIWSHQDYTLSYINGVVASPGETLPTFTNGINGFFIAAYDGNTEILNTSIENIISNGGGQDTAPGDEIQPTGGYNGVSIQTGIRNSLLNGQTYTHMYICPWAWLNGYSPTTLGVVELGDWYRFEFNDPSECNDFDPIEVSWLNSFGFRDYFVFQKRKDYSINITRDTYQKVNGTWSEATFGVNQYDRGEAVFSQLLEENYTINTRYLKDDEATFLKNLFISPDVRVRFYGDTDWTPVVLTSNTWNERTFRKDRLFQNTITFKTSNKLNIQRGV